VQSNVCESECEWRSYETTGRMCTMYDVNIYVGGGGDCCTVAQGQGDISGFDGGI